MVGRTHLRTPAGGSSRKLASPGAWRSLVARSAGGRKVASSNLAAPTKQAFARSQLPLPRDSEVRWRCCGPCSPALGPPDHADRGDRAQVLDQHAVDGESALAQPVGQLVSEDPGSLRCGVARVPEDVDGPIPGEVLADGTERR